MDYSTANVNRKIRCGTLSNINYLCCKYIDGIYLNEFNGK